MRPQLDTLEVIIAPLIILLEKQKEHCVCRVCARYLMAECPICLEALFDDHGFAMKMHKASQLIILDQTHNWPKWWPY